MTKHISAMELRKHLGEMMNAVALRKDAFIIERAGKPVAALVPLETLEFSQADPRREVRERFFQTVNELRKQFEDVPQADLDAMIEEAVAYARRSPAVS